MEKKTTRDITPTDTVEEELLEPLNEHRGKKKVVAAYETVNVQTHVKQVMFNSPSSLIAWISCYNPYTKNTS